MVPEMVQKSPWSFLNSRASGHDNGRPVLLFPRVRGAIADPTGRGHPAEEREGDRAPGDRSASFSPDGIRVTFSSSLILGGRSIGIRPGTQISTGSGANIRDIGAG